MNEVYEFEGQVYHVSPEKLEKFKLEFPYAVKTGKVPGQQFQTNLSNMQSEMALSNTQDLSMAVAGGVDAAAEVNKTSQTNTTSSGINSKNLFLNDDDSEWYLPGKERRILPNLRKQLNSLGWEAHDEANTWGDILGGDQI